MSEVASIKQCDRVERLERSMLVIEGLCLREMDENPLVNQIYRIVHSALGMCSNPHGDWLESIDQLQDDLKHDNIVDIDRLIAEKTNRVISFSGEKPCGV